MKAWTARRPVWYHIQSLYAAAACCYELFLTKCRFRLEFCAASGLFWAPPWAVWIMMFRCRQNRYMGNFAGAVVETIVT